MAESKLMIYFLQGKKRKRVGTCVMFQSFLMMTEGYWVGLQDAKWT